MANNQTPRLLKYLIAMLLLFSLSPAGFGLELLKPENPVSLFRQANNSYQKGAYHQAADIYRQLITHGYKSGNLYYNLGNSYYKLGQKGMAILYYEKAKRLIPGDADLNANLTYVRNKTGQLTKGAWYHELCHFLAYLAPINQLTLMSSILFFILCALIIYILLVPRKISNGEGRLKPLWLYGLMVISIVFLITLSITVLTARVQSQNQAVAVNEISEVRFEPNALSTPYYELTEGAVVNIVTIKDGWALIKRADGKRGWVEEKQLSKI